MKFKVTLKDPDGFYDGVAVAVRDSVNALPDLLDDEERKVVTERRTKATWKRLAKFVEYQEYVEIEFDTDAGTATVLEKGQ